MSRRPRTRAARIWRARSAGMAPVCRRMLKGEEVIDELCDRPAVPVDEFAEKARQAALLVLQIAGREGDDLDRDRGEAGRGHPGVGASPRLLDTGDRLRASHGELSSREPPDVAAEEELPRPVPGVVGRLKVEQGLGGERAAVQLQALERPPEGHAPVGEAYHGEGVPRLSELLPTGLDYWS